MNRDYDRLCTQDGITRRTLRVVRLKCRRVSHRERVFRARAPAEMKPKVLFLPRVKKETKPGYSVFVFGFLSNVALLAAVYAIADLDAEDKVSAWRGASLFLLGIAYFSSLYNFCVHLMQRTSTGQRIIKKYRLNTSDVLDISNKIVSSVQALFSCLTGWRICSYSCSRNLMRTSHYVSHAYSWFGASYFLYDIWSMYKVHVNTPPGQIDTPSVAMSTPIPPPHAADEPPSTELRKFLRYLRLNPIIVGHHLFIGLFGFSVIIYLRGNLGDCVFGFVFLMEASTPFVSLRSVLSRFQLKSSKLYIYNGFSMLVVFFLCRVVMFPYVMKMYADAANLDYLSAVASLPTGCKISIAILTLPQLYWFYLMIKGATKILKEPRSRTSTPANVARALLPDGVRETTAS